MVAPPHAFLHAKQGADATREGERDDDGFIVGNRPQPLVDRAIGVVILRNCAQYRRMFGVLRSTLSPYRKILLRLLLLLLLLSVVGDGARVVICLLRWRSGRLGMFQYDTQAKRVCST